MLKSAMMLCVMMLPLVVVGCDEVARRASAWPPRPGVDNAAPSTGRHRTGLFHPQREADHYAKTTEVNPEGINEQCR